MSQILDEAAAGGAFEIADGTHRTVSRGDVDLAVYEFGDPSLPTVVLMHGWPDSHHLWTGVIPLLTPKFHVVAYDQRGHGGSSDPGSWQAFDLAELALDFYAVIGEVSPSEPVHVLAHDWGSVQVWEAICEPGAEERVASFTSVSGPNLDHLSAWFRRSLRRPTPRNLGAALGQFASASYTFMFQAPVLPKLAFSVASPALWKTFLKNAEGTAAQHVHLAPTFERDLVSGLRIYRANIIPRLLNPRERHTTVPVQLIVNSRDVAVKPAGYDDEARWTERLWRRDTNAGHWVPFSRPQLLARSVIELVEHLDGAEPSRELRRARVDGAPRGGGRFEEQLVVVTGAGSGIGRETALAFAREGAEIVACDRNLAAVKETAALVIEAGGSAHFYEIDVADEAAMKKLAKSIRHGHGVPDVVVNNAGIGQAGAFLATGSDEFQKVLDVNLNGVVYGCRAFAPAMVARGEGGQIVNLSSLAAFSPQRAMSAYATSKAAVLMFSECLRAELAETGVGVTAICPGVVNTNIVANTHFTGVSAAEEAGKQARFDALYRRRNYPPSKVASRILDAVEKNAALMPVTPESYQGYYSHRIAPGISRRLAQFDLV